MTLHSLSGAWPISKPVQRLAGIRRLERNARRWRLRISRWIYEVTGPRYTLRCFDTHVETRSPPISLQRMNYPIDGALTLALSRKREREASSYQPPYPSPPHFSLLISVRLLPPRSSPARSRPPCSCGETPPPPCIPRN